MATPRRWCDDLRDLGLDVHFEGTSRIRYRCRPDSLRRALRNLIENAVRYGERARVSIDRTSDGMAIR